MVWLFQAVYLLFGTLIILLLVTTYFVQILLRKERVTDQLVCIVFLGDLDILQKFVSDLWPEIFIIDLKGMQLLRTLTRRPNTVLSRKILALFAIVVI